MADDTEGKGDAAAPAARLRWDDSDLLSRRADIASASAGRTSVELCFGATRSQARPGAETAIELQHRVVLEPVAAKRLQELLTQVIAEYEARRREAK